MKTREDIIVLKAKWINDPSWDIEETAGFEDHAQELLEFRKQYEDQKKRENEERWTFLAHRLGITSLPLVAYLEELEQRIAALEEKAGSEI